MKLEFVSERIGCSALALLIIEQVEYIGAYL
jgi:hypothetical protein